MARRNLTLSRLTETDLNIVLGLIDDLTQNLDTKGRIAVSAILSGALSLKDADLTIVDDIDGTKRFQFQASGITTGTMRTYTLPDVSSTIAVRAIDNQFSTQQTFNGPITMPGATAPTTDSATWIFNETAVGLAIQSGGTMRLRTNASTTDKVTIDGAGDVTAIGYVSGLSHIGSYSPGTYTIPTESYVVMAKRLTLTGTQRVTIAGTGRLAMVA